MATRSFDSWHTDHYHSHSSAGEHSRYSCSDCDADGALATKWHFCFWLYFKTQHSLTSNQAFEESFPVTQVFFQGKQLEFTLDTGATHTVLSPPFPRGISRSPEVFRAQRIMLTGVGGRFPITIPFCYPRDTSGRWIRLSCQPFKTDCYGRTGLRFEAVAYTWEGH